VAVLPTYSIISIHVLIGLLTSCAAHPVVVQPGGQNRYTLLYTKRPIDSVVHMRRELADAAAALCQGGYRQTREYPDPTELPSRELLWDIECRRL
jgi:hypothetical protein